MLQNFQTLQKQIRTSWKLGQEVQPRPTKLLDLYTQNASLTTFFRVIYNQEPQGDSIESTRGMFFEEKGKKGKGRVFLVDEKCNAYRQVIRIPQDPESSDLRI